MAMCYPYQPVIQPNHGGADISNMGSDAQRANFRRDYDTQKQQRVDANRAKVTPAVPARSTNAAELKKVKGELADERAKIERLKNIAVEMSKRSARMSNVPGYVLKNYADELIKQINGR